MSAQHTPGPVIVEKCRCGHKSCSQYTLSTQGSVGFSLEDATLYAAASQLLADLIKASRVLRRAANTAKTATLSSDLNRQADEMDATIKRAVTTGEPA